MFPLQMTGRGEDYRYACAVQGVTKSSWLVGFYMPELELGLMFQNVGMGRMNDIRAQCYINPILKPHFVAFLVRQW